MNYINSKFDSKFIFKCQHGRNECIGNIFHACARQYLSFNQFMDYLFCYFERIFKEGDDHFSTTEICGKKLKFDHNKIIKCVQGAEGNNIMHSFLKRKEILDDKIRNSPWILLNNTHYPYVQKKIEKDMISYLCKLIEYDKSVSACDYYKFINFN
jgi:interferon gamma-inducible protein 30